MENIKDLCGFPGFKAQARVKAHPKDSGARVVVLRRRQKKQFARPVAQWFVAIVTGVPIGYEIWI